MSLMDTPLPTTVVYIYSTEMWSTGISTAVYYTYMQDGFEQYVEQCGHADIQFKGHIEIWQDEPARRKKWHYSVAQAAAMQKGPFVPQ